MHDNLLFRLYKFAVATRVGCVRLILTTSVVVDGNWYDRDERTARLTDDDGLATIQNILYFANAQLK